MDEILRELSGDILLRKACLLKDYLPFRDNSSGYREAPLEITGHQCFPLD